jgi:polyribonucleotide nucleotidyltransferase
MFKVKKEEIEINGKKITLETGKIARQADGAIIATCGETVVIATVVGAIFPVSNVIFFPLISISSFLTLNITSLNLVV